MDSSECASSVTEKRLSQKQVTISIYEETREKLGEWGEKSNSVSKSFLLYLCCSIQK